MNQATITADVKNDIDIIADVTQSATITADVTTGGAGPAGPPGPAGSVGPQGLPGTGVPPAGITHQVLTKNSSADYDTRWAAPAVPRIVVASATASDDWIAAATYICDGVDDDIQLQAAIDDSIAGKGAIELSPGNFWCSNPLNFLGVDDVNTEITVYMIGQGKNSSIINGKLNTAAIHLGKIIKVSFHDFGIAVYGSGDGITSTASSVGVHRSFWDSTFDNLHVFADFATHTGWAMNLGSPFRSTFNNIEIGGVGNGIKLYSEYSDFNPGDSTFNRVFVELASASPGVAYQLSSPTGKGTVNQIAFNTCEAIAQMAGCTGILLDGAVGSNWNRFYNTNLEQMATSVDVSTGEGNIFQLDYTQPRDGGTFFHCGATALNNTFSSLDAFVDGTSLTLFHDENSSNTLLPNRLLNTKVLANSGTLTNSLVDGSVLRDVVYTGGGTVPAYLTYWQGTIKVAVPTNQSSGAMEIVNDSGGGGGASDTLYIHNGTNFAYGNSLIKLEQKNSTDTGDVLLVKNSGTSSSSVKVTDGSNNVKFSVSQAGLTTTQKLVVATPTVPGTAVATGTAGTIAWDSGFIYICIAANTWKRVAIASW